MQKLCHVHLQCQTRVGEYFSLTCNSTAAFVISQQASEYDRPTTPGSENFLFPQMFFQKVTLSLIENNILVCYLLVHTRAMTGQFSRQYFTVFQRELAQFVLFSRLVQRKYITNIARRKILQNQMSFYPHWSSDFKFQSSNQFSCPLSSDEVQ